MKGNIQDLDDFQPWKLHWAFVIGTVPSVPPSEKHLAFSFGKNVSVSCKLHGLHPILYLAV